MHTNAEQNIELRSAKTLKPHPLQATYFREANDAELEALAEDMRRNGQLTPVEILPDGTIVTGHQRTRAARLNKRKVRCIVRHDLAELGEAAVEERFLEDNLHRRQLSDLEVARCYVRLRDLERQRGRGERKGDLRDRLGKLLDKSGRHLDRLVKVLGTPKMVQHAYEAKQITLELASRVALVDKGLQKQIAKRIRAGEKPRAVVEVLAPPKPYRCSTYTRLAGELRREIKRRREILETLDVQEFREQLRGTDAELYTSHAKQLCSLVSHLAEA